MTDLRSRDDIADSVRARRGAHRPAPSRLAALLPVLLVLGAAAVLALGVWMVMGLGGQGASSAGGAASAVATGAPAPTSEALAPPADPSSPDASTGAPAEPAAPAEPPAATSPPSAAATPSTTAPSAAPVDTDVPLVVLNATRTQGLAASTARTLEREGWDVASTGNDRGAAVSATVVRYPDADLEATARAVAADLGSSVEVELDPDVEDDAVTVVVGPDQEG